MSEHPQAIHCTVSGRVQGVFYRSFTRKQARKLGLTGWVKNLSDGRVEVFACGPKAALDSLIQQLARGPFGAKVQALAHTPATWQDLDEFSIIK